MRRFEMHLIVLYDISNDRLRSKIADACLDYGLERVQFSAFAGELGRVHQRELELKIRDLVGRRAAKVRFVPLDALTWRNQHVIEHAPDDGVAGPGGSGAERQALEQRASSASPDVGSL
jgi:CRISPR-associated protein Cas2